MRDRVKIADVVRISGVSRATVDRVLNARSGVREQTREQVVRALEQLGYAPDALTSLLNPRIKNIRVFLLKGTNPFFAEIRRGFAYALNSIEALGVATSTVEFDPYAPETLERALTEQHSMSAAIIAVGANTPGTARAIRALTRRGIPVVTVISDIPGSKRSAFIGQDNFAAGETAGHLMSHMLDNSTTGTIGMLIGHVQFGHLTQRFAGFKAAIARTLPGIKLIDTAPYGGSDGQSDAVVNTLFDDTPDLCGVYLTGGGQPRLIDALAARRKPGQVIIGHELNAQSRNALRDGTVQALVCHDMDQVARLAVETAIAASKSKTVGPARRQTKACGINIYLPENLPPE